MLSMSKLLAVTVIVACNLSAQFAQAASKEVFPAQPALAGTMLNGKPYKMDTSKGEIILVTFWATWCPTCQAEMPTFRKFYEANKKSGFELVTVSIDDVMTDIDDYAKQAKWLSKDNQGFPSLWRNAADYQDNFGKVFATPTVFLIGRDGKVLESFKGGIKPAQWAHIKAIIQKQASSTKS
ncbi:TlpA family protein disulfide reductase [Undibacterium sp. Tian12W]|uniref:TlpA family protein disulfide reductase n=1 Tax=Undibacterium sp. Tian12W TaxID=3413054 RepID=UPI003BEF813B